MAANKVPCTVVSVQITGWYVPAPSPDWNEDLLKSRPDLRYKQQERQAVTAVCKPVM